MSPILNIEEEKAKRVALVQVKGLGSVTLRRLLSYFGSATTTWQAEDDDWLSAGINRRVIDEFEKIKRKIDPNEIYSLYKRNGIRIYCLGIDPDYPVNLAKIKNPPMVIYAMGRLQLSDSRSLAIVGTRKPTEYGREMTMRLTGELVVNGFSIISGLARGVDIFAHKACVEAGGRTIAVLGSGINRLYPQEHRGWAQKAVSDNLLVVLSTFSPLEEPHRGNFAARNRFIAGLSLGVIVVEGAQKSGTRITSDYASEQGKPVFAIPGQVDNIMSQAPLELIQNGAKLVRNGSDVVKYLGEVPAVDQRGKSQTKWENRTQKRIWEVLSRGGMTANEMAETMKMNPIDLAVELTGMEMAGLVVRDGERYMIG